MSTPEAPEETDVREARLDADLVALMAAPVDTERLMRGAERRIARLQLVRIAMPWLVAVIVTLLLGPVLWRLAGNLVASLPGVGIEVEFTASGLAALAARLPVYVWAFVAGIGVTVAATVAER